MRISGVTSYGDPDDGGCIDPVRSAGVERRLFSEPEAAQLVV
jgi:hypothetical protein